MAAPLLDGKAAAERLGITERHLRLLITRREIPFIKVGRLNRFDPDDIDRYLDDNRTEACN
jgi:excisionase family DNA binding protein